MEKVNVELSFDADKLEALEYCLDKERTTVKKRMAESLQQLSAGIPGPKEHTSIPAQASAPSKTD